MEPKEEFASVPGIVPEYGAIFMSNTATKRECFRQKIFGLSYSQACFVEQVKAGMILFLYEYEKKKLYGVFQARSDGALNIVPHAYRSSSGKQFPAQVPFSIIWNCSPLSEREFCGAIKENYYSAHKFNFGLSKVQVNRLLRLFSSRRLKDQLPKRQFIENSISKPIRHRLGEERRDADRSSFLCNRVENEHDMENDIAQVILPGNSQIFRDKAGNIIHNVRSAETESVRYEHNVSDDHESSFFPDYLRNSLSDVTRASGNGRSAINDGAGGEYFGDSNRVAVTSGEYFGGFWSDARRAESDSHFSINNRIGHGRNGDNPYEPAVRTQQFGNQLDGGSQLWDDREFTISDAKWNRYNGEKVAVTVQPTRCSIGSSDKVKPVAGDDVKFVSNESETQEHGVGNDFGSYISRKYSRNPGVIDCGVGDNDCRLFTGVRMRNEPNADLDCGPVISVGYSGACQSSLNPLMCPSQETGNILVWDQPRPSPASLRSMEPLNSNLPYLAQWRDADGKSTDTYNPETGNILVWDQPRPSPASMRSMESPKSNLPHLTDRRDVGKGPDTYDPEFSSLQCRPTPSSVPFMHSLGSGNYASDIVGPSSDLPSFSRNSFSVVDHGHPFAPEEKFKHQLPYLEGIHTFRDVSLSTRNKGHVQEDKFGHQMPYCEVSDGFQEDVIMSNMNKGYMQEYNFEKQMPYHEGSEAFREDVYMTIKSKGGNKGSSSLQSKGVHRNTRRSTGHDFKGHKKVEGRLSGRPKGRPSVFSRLSEAPKVCQPENDSYTVADESSFGVNDVMDMLDQHHAHWVKKSKSKLGQNSDVETSWGASVPHSTGRGRSKIVPVEMDADATPDSQVGDQEVAEETTIVNKEVAEETTIVNFKRRSELRKVVDESKANESKDSFENANRERLLPGLGKRRKLIRPKFS